MEPKKIDSVEIEAMVKLHVPTAEIPKLNAEQVEVINAIWQKKDVLSVFPTIYEKSVCFIIPGLLYPATSRFVSLIITPLIDIMDEQIKQLTALNCKVTRLDNNRKEAEYRQFLEENQHAYIFSTPESILKKKLKRVLKDYVINLLVIDECHRVSKKSLKYQKIYRKLNEIRNLTDAPLAAFTRTCNEKIKQDVYKWLSLNSNCKLVSKIGDRFNVYIQYADAPTKPKSLRWIVDYLKLVRNESSRLIIYPPNILKTFLVYKYINLQLTETKQSDEVEMFHEITEDEDQRILIESLQTTTSKIRCVVATDSLGPEINVSNVVCVCHLGIPSNWFDYWQQIGHCEKDGDQEAFSILMFPRGKFGKIGLKSGKCLRRSILSQITFESVVEEEMERFQSDLHLCKEKNCEEECFCRLCSCCSECALLCNCTGTRKEFKL